MVAHLFATLKDTLEPAGQDIRRAPVGYLAGFRGVIVRTVKVHHMNIRSAGLRTPAGAGRFEGSDWSLSWHTHGARRPPPAGPEGLPPRGPHPVSWRATYGIGTRPRKSPNRIHQTASIDRGPDCGRLPQELTTVDPRGRR